MSSALSSTALAEAIERLVVHMEPHIADLNKLDGELGDGDLGVTMARGLEALQGLGSALPDDVGTALTLCAKAVTAASGSTFGTLMATGLLTIAGKVKGRDAVEWWELGTLLKAAAEAMSARSGAVVGDKTVLDSLEYIVRSVEGLSDPASIRQGAERACRQAIEDFRCQTCRQGRARMFGDRTRGRDDPGMVALLRIVEAL